MLITIPQHPNPKYIIIITNKLTLRIKMLINNETVETNFSFKLLSLLILTAAT